MIGGVVIIAAAIILLGLQFTGMAVFSSYEIIQEGNNRQIGFEGVLYTVSTVQVIDGDNAIIEVTSDQSEEIQTIQVREWNPYKLEDKIGNANIYVGRISKTGSQNGNFVRLRIEPSGPSNTYGWKSR